MKRINVVYSVITNEQETKVLMVKNKDNNTWTLPGGKVEDEESLEEGAIRETKEETGYNIKVYGVLSVNEAILEASQVHATFVTFRSELIDGEQQISCPDEISAIEWVDIYEADKLMPYYIEGISGLINSKQEVLYFNEGRVK